MFIFPYVFFHFFVNISLQLVLQKCTRVLENVYGNFCYCVAVIVLYPLSIGCLQRKVT